MAETLKADVRRPDHFVTRKQFEQINEKVIQLEKISQVVHVHNQLPPYRPPNDDNSDRIETLEYQVEKLFKICKKQQDTIEEQKRKLGEFHDVIKENNVKIYNDIKKQEKRLDQFYGSRESVPVKDGKIMWDKNQCDECKRRPVKTKEFLDGWNLCIDCWKERLY